MTSSSFSSRLDRPVAQDVVGDVLDQPGLVGRRQRCPFLGQRRVQLLVHPAAQVVLRQSLVVEDRTELVDQVVVDFPGATRRARGRDAFHPPQLDLAALHEGACKGTSEFYRPVPAPLEGRGRGVPTRSRRRCGAWPARHAYAGRAIGAPVPRTRSSWQTGRGRPGSVSASSSTSLRRGGTCRRAARGTWPRPTWGRRGPRGSPC